MRQWIHWAVRNRRLATRSDAGLGLSAYGAAARVLSGGPSWGLARKRC